MSQTPTTPRLIHILPFFSLPCTSCFFYCKRNLLIAFLKRQGYSICHSFYGLLPLPAIPTIWILRVPENLSFQFVYFNCRRAPFSLCSARPSLVGQVSI